MNQKHYQSTDHASANVMKENLIQINGGIMINVNVSVKSIVYVKQIIFGILVHVFVQK